MNTNKNTARIAGILYLILIISGGFSEMYVRSNFIITGDAAATAKNIMDSERLFRIGFLSDIVMIAAYFLLGLTFYRLLKSVNKNVALLMILINLVGVPIMAINMLNYFATLLLLNGEDYLKVFETNQLNALALFFLNLHKFGYLIATFSFGTWLLPLGYLIFKSEYFPKFIGILLIIGSFGYLIDFLTQFLFSGAVTVVSSFALIPAIIGEISICLWLLVKGVKIPAIKS